MPVENWRAETALFLLSRRAEAVAEAPVNLFGDAEVPQPEAPKPRAPRRKSTPKRDPAQQELP